MEFVNNIDIRNNISCVNRNILKYIVIILMVLDHVSFFMAPEDPLVFGFQFVSRLTALIMCFFIAEGYFYTRNVNAYMKRMFLFSIVSYLAYSFAFTGHIIPISLVHGQAMPHYGINLYGYVPQIAYYAYLNMFNTTVVFVENSMIFTLFLGLVSLYVWEKLEIPVWSKVIATIAIMYLASFSDYSYFAILFCLIFYFLKNRPALKWIAFSAVGLMYVFNVCLINPFTFTWTYEFMAFRIGIFLTPFLLLFYNGEPGSKSGFNKWFFYMFYPGHLLLIGLMGHMMGAFV